MVKENELSSISNYLERKYQHQDFFKKLNEYSIPEKIEEDFFDFSEYQIAKPRRVTIKLRVVHD